MRPPLGPEGVPYADATIVQREIEKGPFADSNIEPAADTVHMLSHVLSSSSMPLGEEVFGVPLEHDARPQANKLLNDTTFWDFGFMANSPEPPDDVDTMGEGAPVGRQ